MTVPPYVITVRRRFVNLWDPHPSQITLGDIEHALSNQVRWSGHTPAFYSIAEHSVNVALFIESHTEAIGTSPLNVPLLALHGLMHDAHEAYIGDISAPLEDLIAGSSEIPTAIDDIKDRLQACILKTLNITPLLRGSVGEQIVAEADKKAWALEAIHFFGDSAQDFLPKKYWDLPRYFNIEYKNPGAARSSFRETYKRLRNEPDINE